MPSLSLLKLVDIKAQNYEDIFGAIQKLKIQSLSIEASQFDKFSVNKLFYDIHQGLMSVSSLKLCGGLDDSHLSKLQNLSNRVKEIDLS